MRIIEVLDQISQESASWAAFSDEALRRLRREFPHYDSLQLRTAPGATAALSVPLRRGGEVVGTLELDKGSYNAADLAILEAAATIFAQRWARENEIPHWRDATRAVAAITPNEPGVKPVALSIHPSSTYEFETVTALEEYHENQERGYIYTRWGNPTIRAAETAMAAIERAPQSMLCGSGMAAIATTLLALLRSGDRLVAANNLYGGTYHFMTEVLPSYGIDVELVEVEQLTRLESKLDDRTRVVYFEPITNPTLRVIDVSAVVAGVKEHSSALVVVDNTIATPCYLRPLELGVDVVVHSATKYLGGHSDLLCGAVSGGVEPMKRIRHTARYLGTHFNPREAALLARGLKTLPLRVERQFASAAVVAEWLQGRAGITRVNHPRLPAHPDHAVAKRLVDGQCGLVSFDVAGGLTAARAVVDALTLFHHAASLGGVESLVSIPVLASHHNVAPEVLERAGISDGTIRLSIGVEDVDDLLGDLEQALACLPQAVTAK